MNIKDIAEAAGLDLTTHGNLKLGSNDQGVGGQPGSAIKRASVTYYLMSYGEFCVVIDDRHGRNQGYFEVAGGDCTDIPASTLDEAIGSAKDYIESMANSSSLMRAWVVSSADARKTMRTVVV